MGEEQKTVSEATPDLTDATNLSVLPPPNILKLNVDSSSKITLGPKYLSVQQDVLDADLEKQLPLQRYIWDVVKNSSTSERLLCAFALIAVIVCVSLLIYFATKSAQALAFYDIAPHEWYITREMWLARPFTESNISSDFKPIMFVIIHHTVGPVCYRFPTCAAELRNLQQWHIELLQYDIPYNFLVGNDGRVYEGRGWDIEGAHTLSYNRCTVGIGFTGDYQENVIGHATVTEAQMNRTRMILEQGIKLGYLRPDYLIVPALDVRDTLSPGSNLYKAIQQWPNYDHEHRFRGLSCEEIQELYGNQTFLPHKT